MKWYFDGREKMEGIDYFYRGFLVVIVVKFVDGMRCFVLWGLM